MCTGGQSSADGRRSPDHRVRRHDEVGPAVGRRLDVHATAERPQGREARLDVVGDARDPDAPAGEGEKDQQPVGRVRVDGPGAVVELQNPVDGAVGNLSEATPRSPSSLAPS